MSVASTFLLWTPSLPATGNGGKQSIKYFRFTISAKFNRKSRPWNNTLHNYSDFEDYEESPSAQDIGGLGRRIVADALSSGNTLVPEQQKQRKQSSDEGKQLSGSDVLQALQKANAQKTKKKKRKDSSSISSSSPIFQTRGRNATKQDDERTADYSHVRPLCIKNDWMMRLEELEKQLQQLIDT